LAKEGKKISLAQAGALFVILFMVGSTIAFGLLSSENNDNGADGGQQDNGQPQQQQSPISYEASNIDASIQQLLPSARVVGETMDYDFAKIDRQIYAIEGVKKVQSGYQPNTDTNGGYYLADISFGADYNAEYMSSQLSEKTELQNAEIYSYAILEIPKNVSLKNAQLNLSKEYEFSAQRVTGLVGIDSMPLDKIKALLSVSLSGDRLVSATAIETENVSASPTERSIHISMPVASLENEIVFSGEYALPSGITEADLNARLSAIADVNSVSVYLYPPTPFSISVSVDGNSVAGIEKDVNALLISDFGISSEITSDANSVNVSIDYNDKLAVDNVAASVIGLLSSKYPEAAAKAEYPKTQIEGSLGLESGKAESVAAEAKKILEGKGVSLKSLFRFAGISAATIESEGKTYAIDSGSIPALVKPETKENETVAFDISFYSSRDKAVYANAVQANAAQENAAATPPSQ